MIIEHVHLHIKPSQSHAFEQAFHKAKEIVYAAQGFHSLQLMKKIEDEHCYILMIIWDKLEDHTEGFRKSEAYLEWKALLHPFYEPMPTVEYYQPCVNLNKEEV